MPPIRAYHLSLATRIRERSMLRQSRQRSARRRVPQQIDLFAENAPTIGGMPAWFGLPMETQAALTTLITRLILDHAGKRRMGSTRDGHESPSRRPLRSLPAGRQNHRP